VAVDYYEKGDLYMFDVFQYQSFKALQSQSQAQSQAQVGDRCTTTSDSPEWVIVPSSSTTTSREDVGSAGNAGNVAVEGSVVETKRRPVISNLYDVFCCIRADEAEHAETMGILQRDVCLRSRGRDDN
jgi:hypothetical protein